MNITKEPNNKIIIGNDSEGYIISTSVESNLLYMILLKLGEIKDGLIDVENAIDLNVANSIEAILDKLDKL